MKVKIIGIKSSILVLLVTLKQAVSLRSVCDFYNIIISGIWSCSLANSCQIFGEVFCHCHQCVCTSLISANAKSKQHEAISQNLWPWKVKSLYPSSRYWTFELLLHMQVHHSAHNSLTFQLILKDLNTVIPVTTFFYQIFPIVVLPFKPKCLRQAIPMTFQIKMRYTFLISTAPAICQMLWEIIWV